MDRLLIAGTHSGCGKTTVTCALLMALKNRGLGPAAFKCGPDYIDPMFHRRAIGVPAHNLDPFFNTGGQLRQRLAACPAGIALLEGAMGYYDGIGAEGRFSAFDVARDTGTPVVLVIDARGLYASAGAMLKGFLDYRAPSGIQGVIFNNAAPSIHEGLRTIAARLGVRPLGFLPREPRLSIASRQLGLITADEIADLTEKLTRMGELAEQSVDIEGLLALAAGAPALEEFACEGSADAGPTAAVPAPGIAAAGGPAASAAPSAGPAAPVRIAVARDDAFCFLYEENLERLRTLGCELAFFSPLTDTALPAGAGGLYLCGGYPELHLAALSDNTAMRTAIRTAIQDGLPTIAECGGFLYLHDTLDGFPMAGFFPARAYRTQKLQRFGYVTLRAAADNLLCTAGESFRAHEFHYYESTDSGAGFVAEKPFSDRHWPCVHATAALYAGFPHLYFDAHPAMAENFTRKATEYAHTRFA